MKDYLKLITNNQSVALLAPSFPVNFEYPQIIGMLRKLGFDHVTELTFGARMVNWNYVEYIKHHPQQELFIASPCPTVVKFIQTQFPEMTKFLMPVSSPMLAAARIYKKHHPKIKTVFISPCFAKQQIEAPKYRNDIDLVITFSELEEMFETQKIRKEDFNRDYFFDSLIQEFTKIYPISGGLGSTSHISKLFKSDEILVTDEIANIKQALEDIKDGKQNYRFLDILNCPGGCIGGPATNQEMTTEEKKEKIKGYLDKSSLHSLGSHKGRIDYAKEIDLSVRF